jgi:hypothetical protein
VSFDWTNKRVIISSPVVVPGVTSITAENGLYATPNPITGEGYIGIVHGGVTWNRLAEAVRTFIENAYEIPIEWKELSTEVQENILGAYEVPITVGELGSDVEQRLLGENRVTSADIKDGEVKTRDIADAAVTSRKIHPTFGEDFGFGVNLDSSWRSIASAEVNLDVGSHVLIVTRSDWVQTYDGGKLIQFNLYRNGSTIRTSFWRMMDSHDAIPYSDVFIDRRVPSGSYTYELKGAMPEGGTGRVSNTWMFIIPFAQTPENSLEFVNLPPKPPLAP